MFNFPEMNKLYELDEDLVRKMQRWDRVTQKYEDYDYVVPAGSVFKITVIHLSQHQDYCTLQFAKKYNKDTPLRESTKFAISTGRLNNIRWREYEVPSSKS